MQRYYTQSGDDPIVDCKVRFAGPQAASEIPEGVKLILDMPGVKEIAIVFNHGLGERMETFRKVEA